MRRPAGILVPDRKVTGLVAGFGQIQAQVMKVGMIGEVTCVAKPWQTVPMVVTDVQNVIAAGQMRPTDQLFDIQQFAKPGTITVILEPLYPGQLDDLPQGGSCIANAPTPATTRRCRTPISVLCAGLGSTPSTPSASCMR